MTATDPADVAGFRRLAAGAIFDLIGSGTLPLDRGQLSDRLADAALAVIAPRIREQAAAEILRPVPYEGDKETGEIYEAAQAVQIALGASRRAGVCVEWKPPGSDKAWRVWVEDRDNPHLHAHCHSDWTCEYARNLRGEQ